MPRKPRVEQTRTTESRESNVRTMPNSAFVGRLFVDPSRIPHGWTYGWVRISTFGEPDDNNWDAKSAGGWSPVPRDTHPELSRGSLMPGRTSDAYAGVIVRGGLLLCKKPTAEVEADKDRFRAVAQQRFQKVNEWRGGEGADPMMPRFDNSSVEFAHGPAIKKDG